ncbi:MAG: phosphoglucosamine mutase [Coriobacteriales bacterium]|nr:phosphoglucosamine mutase [Coriobacteriales bacterium]
MKRYFGTDGVRGIAGTDLDGKTAFILGAAAVALLGPRLVIGKDTRRSGDMLEAALVAGITSRGGTALLAGIIPTPAVALLTRQLGANGGVVISASHNPPEYNGIKFFDAQGFKLTTAQEDSLEDTLQDVLDRGATGSLPSPATGDCIGTSHVIEDARERYIQHATGVLKNHNITLDTLKVAVDCGNGAAFATTPEALRRLGAEVTAINDAGDGDTINVESGSTDVTALRELVRNVGADLGIAHDGDADRTIALDALGNTIDGDYIEAICALDMNVRGELPNTTIVSTVMCNLGLIKAMRAHGIQVIQTAVGDANVLEAMRQGGHQLGGEQSGHMIFLKHNTTGDGLITALMLMAAMQRSGRTLADLANAALTKYPQQLINVTVANKTALLGNEVIAEAISETEDALERKGGGRVLVRASGTEELVRVMVEAVSEQTALEQAEKLATVVTEQMSGD